MLPPALPTRMAWYFKPGMVVIAFLTVGPLMLPLVWFHPTLKPSHKLLWSIAIVAVTALLTWMSIHAIRLLIESYRQLELAP